MRLLRQRAGRYYSWDSRQPEPHVHTTAPTSQPQAAGQGCGAGAEPEPGGHGFSHPVAAFYSMENTGENGIRQELILLSFSAIFFQSLYIYFADDVAQYTFGIVFFE